MTGTLAWLTAALASPSWIPLLVDLALKGAVVLLLAAGLTRAVRGASAALRHQIWTVALVSLLALPVLTLALPSWRVPLLPATSISVGTAPVVATLPAVERSPAPGVAVDGSSTPSTDRAPDAAQADPGRTGSAALEGDRAGDGAGESTASRAALGAGLETPTGNGTPTGAGTTAATGEATASRGGADPGVVTGPAPEAWSVSDAAGVAVVVWLLGAAALLARLLVGAASAAWLTARARPVDDPAWRELAGRLARRLDLSAPVDLRRSSRIRTPMAWGIRRAAVLLPVESEDWTADRRRVVLLHEMAHLKRRDCLVQLLADAATALHWLNPLAWWGGRRLRAEREQACDDLVLAAGTPRADYARHLLEIARGLKGLGTPGWAAVSMARPSQLEGRLLAILDPERDRRTLTRVASLGLTAAVVLFLVPLATLQPWAVAEPAGPHGGARATAGGPGNPALTPRSPATVQELRGAFRRGVEQEAETGGVLERALASGALEELLDSGALDELLRDASGVLHQVLDSGVLDGTLQDGPMEHAMTAARHELEHRFSHAGGLEGGLDGGMEALRYGARPVIEGVTWRLEGLVGNPEVLGRMAADALAGGMTSGQDVQEPEGQEAEAARDALRGRVLEAMSAALGDPDADMRRQAAQSLGQMENPAAVAALGQALSSDEDAGVREQVAWALGMIEDAAAVPHLEAAIDDSDEGVRKQVVWALGMIEDASAVPALGRLLADASVEIRGQAAWALGMVEDPAAVDALATAMDDAEAAVRKQAAWALGMIEDPTGVDVLAAAVDDPDAEVRGQVVWALGMIEDAAAVPTLAVLLDDEQPEIRKQAAWALGMIEDETAVDALVAALTSDPDVEVRSQAAWALGMIESEAAADALIDALEDESNEVRRHAMEALSRVLH